MILYPAIDLKDGVCVRLLKGELEQATVFNTDPASQARYFEEAGSEWIHIVDLNGAFEGRPVNHDAVSLIVKQVDIPVQLGGGIRDMATIEHWLKAGVARVVLGTAAVKNPALVREACREFPGKIAVGVDAKGGLVAVEGWAETSNISAYDLAVQFEDIGVAAIIHTDIDRDGILQGPNVDATADLAKRIRIPVIASGGVSSIEDLIALKARSFSGISGVICGRALYDGHIDLAVALAVLKD